MHRNCHKCIQWIIFFTRNCNSSNYSTKKRKKERRKEWLQISSSFSTSFQLPQVSNTSISTNFTSLSACHPFENTKIPSTIPPLTLLLVTRAATRSVSMRTMVERWIAFVVDEGKTNKKNKKRKKTFESVLHGEGEEGRGGKSGELKPLTRDRCMHMWYVRAPLLPEQIDSVLHVHRAIQITVHQAAYSRRYGTPLKLARKDYRRISFRLFREAVLWAKMTIDPSNC